MATPNKVAIYNFPDCKEKQVKKIQTALKKYGVGVDICVDGNKVEVTGQFDEQKVLHKLKKINKLTSVGAAPAGQSSAAPPANDSPPNNYDPTPNNNNNYHQEADHTSYTPPNYYHDSSSSYMTSHQQNQYYNPSEQRMVMSTPEDDNPNCSVM